MPSKQDEYLALTTGKGVAPCGMEFSYRGLKTIEAIRIHKSIPTFSSRKETTNGSAEMTPEETDSYQKQIVIAGTISPRIVPPGEDPGEDGISVDVLAAEDVFWLCGRIQKTSGMAGKEAEELADTFPE